MRRVKVNIYRAAGKNSRPIRRVNEPGKMADGRGVGGHTSRRKIRKKQPGCPKPHEVVGTGLRLITMTLSTDPRPG